MTIDRAEMAQKIAEQLYGTPTPEMLALVRSALDRVVPDIPDPVAFGANFRVSVWDRISYINGKTPREVLLNEPVLKDTRNAAIVVEDIEQRPPRVIVLQPVPFEEYPTQTEQFMRAVWAFRFACRCKRDGAVARLVEEKLNATFRADAQARSR